MSQEPPPQPPLGYYPAPPKSGMTTGGKIALGIIIGFCVLTGGCFACTTLIWDNAKRNLNLNSNSAVSSTGSPSSSLPRPTGADAPPQTAWQYGESEDKMTGQKTKGAFVDRSAREHFIGEKITTVGD